jgi:hypothetical protein
VPGDLTSALAAVIGGAFVTAAEPVAIPPAMVAAGFQRTVVAPVLTCRIDSALPVRITTCWRRTLGDTWRPA